MPRSAKLISSLSVTALLILSFFGFTDAAYAKNQLKVSAHSAPPKFFKYLKLHDGDSRKFESEGAWVPPEEADVITIFIANRESTAFVPAILYSSLTEVLNIVDTHFYEIPSKTFGSSLDADVYVISRNKLYRKLASLEVNIPTTSAKNEEFITCFSAGLVNSFYERGDLNGDYEEIGNTCLSWVKPQ